MLFRILPILLLPLTLAAQRVEYVHEGTVYRVDGRGEASSFEQRGETRFDLPEGGEYRVVEDGEPIDFSRFHPLVEYPVREKRERPARFVGEPEQAYAMGAITLEVGEVDNAKAIQTIFGKNSDKEAVALILWVVDGRVAKAVEMRSLNGVGYPELVLNEEEQDGFPVLALVRNSQLIERRNARKVDVPTLAAVGDLLRLTELSKSGLKKRDKSGNTGLHRAALNGHASVVEFLLKQGINPRDTNKEEQLPVMLAALASRVEVLKLLAEADPQSLGVTDPDGNTALHYAVMAGSEEAVRYIIENHREHVNPQQLNEAGWSPFDWSIHHGLDDIYVILRDSLGKDPGLLERVSDLEFALFWVASRDAVSVARDLLAEGAQLEGDSALPYMLAAARGGSKEMVDLLLDAGVSINERGDDKETPLMAATTAGRPEAVKYFISLGAQLDAITNTGSTALSIAREKGYREIAQMLIEAGADPERGKLASTTPDSNSPDIFPRPVKQTAPSYPRHMFQRGIQGTVIVEFVVDTKGLPRDATIVTTPHPAFAFPVLRVVENWRFKPGYKDGRRVNTRLRVPIPFQISKK